MNRSYEDEPFAARETARTPEPPKKIRPGTPEWKAYLRALSPRLPASGKEDGHISFNDPRIGKRE